jgi:hypothetical protein
VLTRACCLTIAWAIVVIGFPYPAPARSEQREEPVLLVTASYPGASASVVTDTIAAPIEQQINGVERMVRIESTSGNDGAYTALVYFKPKTDLESAMKLVQTRVALAEPVLPDVVRRNKVSVKVGKAKPNPNKVAIAVIDRGDNGWKILQKSASAVVKRLEAVGAITEPQVFPRDEKQVYRVGLCPAIRITGAPAEGKSVAATAAKCVELTEAELIRLGSGGFAVGILSPK